MYVYHFFKFNLIKIVEWNRVLSFWIISRYWHEWLICNEREAPSIWHALNACHEFQRVTRSRLSRLKQWEVDFWQARTGHPLVAVTTVKWHLLPEFKRLRAQIPVQNNLHVWKLKVIISKFARTPNGFCGMFWRLASNFEKLWTPIGGRRTAEGEGHFRRPEFCRKVNSTSFHASSKVVLKITI